MCPDDAADAGHGAGPYPVSAPLACIMWALVALVVIGGAVAPTMRRRRTRKPAVVS